MSKRGIEPGTIDTNYVRPPAQSPAANRRGITPGPEGYEKPEVAAARAAAKAKTLLAQAPAQPPPPVTSQPQGGKEKRK